MRIADPSEQEFLDDWRVLDKASGYGIVTGCHPEGGMTVSLFILLVRRRRVQTITNDFERGEHSVDPFTVLPENIDQLVAEYQQSWPLMSMLHGRMAKMAGREAIKVCARRLDMLSRQGNRIGVRFAHDLEAEVFQDYLIYMHRPRGFNLVRQLHNRKMFPEGSREQELLAGMVQARFSVFWIRSVHQGVGCEALDIISGDQLFLLDQSLPQHDSVGLLAAFRIFPFRTAWAHTGANMVLGKIEDAAGLQPMGRKLTEQEERELNEENVRRWRALLAQQAE